jgi:hypothetical protein
MIIRGILAQINFNYGTNIAINISRLSRSPRTEYYALASSQAQKMWAVKGLEAVALNYPYRKYALSGLPITLNYLGPRGERR